RPGPPDLPPGRSVARGPRGRRGRRGEGDPRRPLLRRRPAPPTPGRRARRGGRLHRARPHRGGPPRLPQARPARRPPRLRLPRPARREPPRPRLHLRLQRLPLARPGGPVPPHLHGGWRHPPGPRRPRRGRPPRPRPRGAPRRAGRPAGHQPLLRPRPALAARHPAVHRRPPLAPGPDPPPRRRAPGPPPRRQLLPRRRDERLHPHRERAGRGAVLEAVPYRSKTAGQGRQDPLTTTATLPSSRSAPSVAWPDESVECPLAEGPSAGNPWSGISEGGR